MSSLRAPVRDHLRPPVDEVAARRIWQRVRAGRAATPRRSRRWMLAAAALVAVLAAIVVLRRPAAGPLALDVDRVVLEVELAGTERRVSASDGSAITIAPGARLEVVENTDRAFATLVARGRARFDVHPGGPRRWTVDCGAFVVEVVGTAFVVERDGASARVTVERGEVVVRGERVPGRIARLVAGEELAIDPADRPPDHPPVPAPSTTALDGASAPTAPIAPAPSSAAPGPRPLRSPGEPPPGAPPPASAVDAPEAGAWRGLARDGRFDDAWTALGPEGFRRAAGRASVDELLALADVARLSGHPAEAVAPLERVLREHGGDGRAAIAALTLGRLQLDALGQPAAAAASLNRAIAAGLPGGLVEDALARRVEAYGRAGDLAAARASLDELARRFPSSLRLAPARRWVETGP